MKQPRIWMLVADGGRARVLRDVLGHHPPEPARDELVFRSPQRQLREIMADRPGRSFASVGRRRSAMAYRSDPVRDDDRAFASTLAELLDSHRLSGDFDHLVVAAAPQMLGDLRQAFPPSLKQVTIAEIPKDLVRLAASELRKAIIDMGLAMPNKNRNSQ